MWRRLVSAQRSSWRRRDHRSAVSDQFTTTSAAFARLSVSSASSPSQTPSFHQTNAPFSRAISDSETILSMGKKRVEDVMPIATGHEREELEAELEGRNILGMNYPVGPFGTKEAPAIIKSIYDKWIVGCPGGEGGGLCSLSVATKLTIKMSMTWCGFGWRKASLMSALSVLNTSCLKWLASEELLMVTETMIIPNLICT